MSRLSAPWTERFKPVALLEIAGNYSASEQLMKWVQSRMQGAPVKRAALLYGPPGTGKTITVEVVAKVLDLELIEMNASDFRTEELVQSVAGGAAMQSSLFGRKGKVVFLDELDGISGREDRGGLLAIMKIIKESRYPIVLAVNDPWDPKFRSLRDLCEMVQFRRIREPSVAVQLKKVARLAGVNATEGAIKKIAEWANGDLRAAINDFQMLAVGRDALTEEDVGMLYARLQEKGIFDVMKEIFSAESCLEAKLAADGASVDPEMLFQWLNENIPNQYPGSGERAEAFDWLSRADVFMSRVKRRQMWELMGYAMELATGGAAVARKGEYRFTRYSFPRRIGILSHTKEERGKKKDYLKLVGKEAHVSQRKAMTEYLPYMEIIEEGMKKRGNLVNWVVDSKET